MSETQCINQLYKLAETCPQEEFQHKALDLLSEIIQFDRAGWGETANTLDSHYMLRTYTYKVSQQIVEDYNKVDHLNPLTPLVKPVPAQTHLFNVKDGSVFCPDEFMAMINKYDIPKLLHTLIVHDNQLFMCSISLWRGHDNVAFTEEDRKIKEILTPHLLESFRLCRRFDMQRKLFKRWELNCGLATCNSEGILFDTDTDFIASLQSDWPDWEGARLPAELIKTLSVKQSHKTSSTFYRCTLVDDLYLLVATKLNHLQQLTDREFEIAYEYSNGKSYKEIAISLGISPSTVKNHLTNIYEKLDLNSKNNLIELFR